jgi:hypothetical protein
MSICFWFNPDTLPNIDSGYDFLVGKLSSGASGWLASAGDLSVDISRTNAFHFIRSFSVAAGKWVTASDVFTPGTIYHVCITMVGTDASVPIVYINGVTNAVTEYQDSSGSLTNDSTDVLEIGGSSLGGQFSFDGKISDVRVYNRILSPAEVLDMYNRRSMNDNINGLVFNPVLLGAAACQAFDGTALATAHKIVDPYSGAIGTPSGSPVGAGETYLTVCP